MSALPPGPGGPPMGAPPPPMGPPPGAGAGPGVGMEGPSPEEVDQLIEMLLSLPREVLQTVSTALSAELAGGGPEEGVGPVPEEPGPEAMREAATARAGV